ncbi:MAG: PaaI family thioesterase [Oscillospiraceae bacterium]|nr:PaaI family thioesterase [Oscillospiraceae bacterium]
MTLEMREKLIRFGNSCNPFDNHNGIRVTDVGDGTATVEVDLHPENLNSWSSPHGGLLFTMADVACGMAAISMRQEVIVTVSTGMDFIAAAGGQGVIRAEGRVVHCGGKMCFCAAEVYDGKNTLLCRMNATMYFPGTKLEV